MRETEEKRGWAENKPAGQEELGRDHDTLVIPHGVVREVYLACNIDLAIPSYLIGSSKGIQRKES